MHFCLRSAGAVKRGNALDEYEDAAWPRGFLEIESPSLRCAVADGASEASYSGEWARVLVRSWCRGNAVDRWLGHLPGLGERWRSSVSQGPLPWYAEEKLAMGAFAAFVGLQVWQNPRPTWVAIAIGDSCLFHMRCGHMLAAFPLQHPELFTHRPVLVPTAGPVPAAQRMDGTWQSGDSFVLTTDALAHWLLTGLRSDGRFPAEIGSLLDRDGALDDLLARGTVRNDDLTLLHLTVR